MPKAKAQARGLLLVLLLLFCGGALAEVNAEAIAETPKKFFQAVNAKEYGTAWGLLTEQTKSELLSSISQELDVPVADLRQRFEANDPDLVKIFWDPFRVETRVEIFTSFTYTYVEEKDGFLVVRVTLPGSAEGDPFDLLVKDEGGYKFGLAESNAAIEEPAN